MFSQDQQPIYRSGALSIVSSETARAEFIGFWPITPPDPDLCDRLRCRFKKTNICKTCKGSYCQLHLPNDPRIKNCNTCRGVDDSLSLPPGIVYRASPSSLQRSLTKSVSFNSQLNSVTIREIDMRSESPYVPRSSSPSASPRSALRTVYPYLCKICGSPTSLRHTYCEIHYPR